MLLVNLLIVINILTSYICMRYMTFTCHKHVNKNSKKRNCCKQKTRLLAILLLILSYFLITIQFYHIFVEFLMLLFFSNYSASYVPLSIVECCSGITFFICFAISSFVIRTTHFSNACRYIS